MFFTFSGTGQVLISIQALTCWVPQNSAGSHPPSSHVLAQTSLSLKGLLDLWKIVLFSLPFCLLYYILAIALPEITPLIWCIFCFLGFPTKVEATQAQTPCLIDPLLYPQCKNTWQALNTQIERKGSTYSKHLLRGSWLARLVEHATLDLRIAVQAPHGAWNLLKIN